MNRQLLTALADPAFSGLDDTAAAAALNTPTYKPRTEPITITTLSGTSVWGFQKTVAFCTALQAVASGSDQASAALADTLLSILRGPGFYASDPQAPAMVPTFVALGGGTITADDGNLAIGVPTYAADGPVTVADVTAARVYIARAASLDAISALNRNRYNAGAANIDKVISDSTLSIPATLADLDAMGAA